MKTCFKCSEKYHAKGLCVKHYNNEYVFKNKDKIYEYKRKWSKNSYNKNKEIILKQHIEYKKNNHNIVNKRNKIYQKTYYNKNKEIVKKRNALYSKMHPEVAFKANMKHLEKYGKMLEMNKHVFQYALLSWSKTIKKLDNYMCKLCDSTTNINAHHFQPKQHFPELILDINNGITLCKKCHMLIHQ